MCLAAPVAATFVNRCSGVFRGAIGAFVKAGDAGVQQGMQRCHALRSKALVERQLGRLPGALPFGALGAAGLGGFDEAAARIAARADA